MTAVQADDLPYSNGRWTPCTVSTGRCLLLNEPLGARHQDPQVKGFSVVKRRWVVERTLGWLMHHRRLVRDDEAQSGNSASMIAMIDNLTKRLTAETTQPGDTAKRA